MMHCIAAERLRSCRNRPGVPKMMLECNISVNLWYQENQMGPVILVALIAPHTPTLISIMSLHNLTLDFLQTHACHSESSRIHLDETKVHR